jgi:exodeoxyribonuclease-3
MKIASWNVNSLNVRLPHLEQWLREFGPDIVGIQETKLEDHKFPDSALIAAGYRSVFAGQKTYNGVALLSREPAQDVQIGIPGFEDEQKRVIAGTFGDLRVINLYVVNGQDIGTDKYDYKLRWLEAVHAWIAEELQRHPKLIVMGDFNIAPDARRARPGGVERQPHPDLHRRARRAEQAAAAGPARWLPPAQRRGGCSAGGITAPPASAATWACAST